MTRDAMLGCFDRQADGCDRTLTPVPMVRPWAGNYRERRGERHTPADDSRSSCRQEVPALTVRRPWTQPPQHAFERRALPW